MDPPGPFHPGATRRVRKTVRVGVGVVIRDASSNSSSGNHEGVKIYCGIRKGSHGSGTLALPGGHLELYESWEDCAVREVLEETGLTLKNCRFLHVTNDIMAAEEKHYVTIFMCAEQADPVARPSNLEPDKCSGWHSYSWTDLQEMARQQQQQGGKEGEEATVVVSDPPEVIMNRSDEDNEEAGQGNNNDSGQAPRGELFGPLLRLVQEAPPALLAFMKVD